MTDCGRDAAELGPHIEDEEAYREWQRSDKGRGIMRDIKCSDCGNDTVEEIITGAEIRTEISVRNGKIVQGAHSIHGGELVYYRCALCGQPLEGKPQHELVTEQLKMLKGEQ